MSPVTKVLLAQDQTTREDYSVERLDTAEFDFYAKYLDCDGIVIRASAVVRDRSMGAICERVNQVLAKSDTARRNMLQRGVELHVVGQSETAARLPEFRLDSSNVPTSEGQPQDSLYGICFERGSEADTADRCTRQIALSDMLYGFDDEMRNQIQQQFTVARAGRLWDGMTAGLSAKEYWSQLSVWYFGGRGDCGQNQQCPAGGPQALKSYDPGGFALVRRISGGLERPRAIEAIRARHVSKQALSRANTLPAELQLVNNSGHSVRVSEMDAEGHITSAGELGPYNRAIYSASLFQVWLVADQKGVELDRFLVENAVSEYIAPE